MILFSIIIATLIGGVVSVLLAGSFTLSILFRFADKMLAFAVGVMLALSLTDMLPEAIELGLELDQAGWMLLGGLFGFFLLEKAALWRHDHSAATGYVPSRPQVAMIILGDSLHNFVDGILIAAAFFADPMLGWATALAIMAHEIPQEISDFIIMLEAGVSKSRALAFNAASGMFMILGGFLGWLALRQLQAVIPYILILASASFIYISISDLVPKLHRKCKLMDTFTQLILMLLGAGTVRLAHAIFKGYL